MDTTTTCPRTWKLDSLFTQRAYTVSGMPVLNYGRRGRLNPERVVIHVEGDSSTGTLSHVTVEGFSVRRNGRQGRWDGVLMFPGAGSDVPAPWLLDMLRDEGFPWVAKTTD